ncbi:MAG: M23 family metallopeptidase, partial [Clostridia bacterium]|nr:M23 family metallopeptidase [Clostridia bacterium]
KTDIAVSEIFDSFKSVVQETFSPNVEEPSGETESTTGEKADFSPVFLTVNFISPIKDGKITSKFGYRVSPITNKFSLHKGLDIAAPPNTKIYAVYDGVVIKAKYHKINGNYIVIKHSDNIKTTYNHCNKLLVKEGEKVKRGEVIALVGETGYATGNHLHFEVLLNGKYINPLYVLSYDF